MLKRAIKITTDFLQSNVWILDGVENFSQETLSLFYAGSEIQKNYISNLIFDSQYEEKCLGKKSFWTIRSLIKNAEYQQTLIMIEGHLLHRFLYEKKNDFFVPLWLKSTSEIPLKVFKRSAKRDQSRLQKSNLTYFISKNTEEFDDFYNNMYLPTVTRRHQNRKVAMGYKAMMTLLRKNCGKLLLVKMGESTIAGVVIKTSGKEPRLWSNGIREGKTSYWKTGAIAATYIFPSEYLSARGYTRMHLGLVRAFLGDGILQYKKKWGPQFSAQGTRGFIIKQLGCSNSSKIFFQNNPFVYLKKGCQYGALFFDNNKQHSEEEYTELKNKYFLAGLKGMNLFAVRTDSKVATPITCLE